MQNKILGFLPPLNNKHRKQEPISLFKASVRINKLFLKFRTAIPAILKRLDHSLKSIFFIIASGNNSTSSNQD